MKIDITTRPGRFLGIVIYESSVSTKSCGTNELIRLIITAGMRYKNIPHKMIKINPQKYILNLGSVIQIENKFNERQGSNTDSTY